MGLRRVDVGVQRGREGCRNVGMRRGGVGLVARGWRVSEELVAISLKD